MSLWVLKFSVTILYLGQTSASQAIIMLDHSKHIFSDDEDTFLKKECTELNKIFSGNVIQEKYQNFLIF